MKVGCNNIHALLAYLLHMSLAQGIFPDQLKYSIIKPIYKNGYKPQISNYRPASLLKGFSKIMKTVISKRLKSNI